MEDARWKTLARLEDPSRVRLWLVLTAAAGLVLAGAWVLSYPGGSLLGYALVTVPVGSVLVWWLFSAIRVAIGRPTGRPVVLGTRAALLAGGVVVAIGLSSFWGLSLRLRFELSRGALEREAKAAPKSAWQRGPGRTGFYNVIRIRLGSGSSIVLVTSKGSRVNS